MGVVLALEDGQREPRIGPDVAEPSRAAPPSVGSQNASAYRENSVGAACARPSGRVEDASA
jgi:hypothetical protein